jgi:hypothetical protein
MGKRIFEVQALTEKGKLGLERLYHRDAQHIRFKRVFICTITSQEPFTIVFDGVENIDNRTVLRVRKRLHFFTDLLKQRGLIENTDYIINEVICRDNQQQGGLIEHGRR